MKTRLVLSAVRAAAVVAFAVAVTAAWQAMASAPAGQYALTTSTVKDRRTGLTWQRTTDSTRRTQTGAAAYCASLEAGVTWRLPTARELLTLVDVRASTSPLIDTTAFPTTLSQQYWTSTPYADPHTSGFVWSVDFNSGVPNGVSTAATTLLVRCVR